MKRFVTLILLGMVTPLWAGDWTQFRGNGGKAIAQGEKVPVQLSEGENLRWKIDLPGRGVSSPIVVGGKVYVTASGEYKDRRLTVLCFDAKTGKQLWQRSITATGNTTCHPKTRMAAPTPASDGKNVYALFATGDLVALSPQGDVLWYRSLVGDYPKITNQVGMAASPIVWKNLLLLPMENAGDSFIAGINLKTGKNVWKVKRPRSTNWVTPVIAKRGEQVQAIFQTREEATAYDPATGKQLWQFKSDEVKTGATPSPLVNEQYVFISGDPYVAVETTAGKSPQVKWKSGKFSTGYTSPIYYQGKLYGARGSQNLITCLNANDGKIAWQQRAAGPFSASPVIVDNKLYAVGEKGTVTVLQLGGNKPKLLSKSELGETILASPAVSGGAIYFRSDTTLWCFGKK